MINYKEADWSDVKAGANVDLIYDCVGTEEDWPKASKAGQVGRGRRMVIVMLWM